MPGKAREDRRSCTRPPLSGRAALAAFVSLGLLATASEAQPNKVTINASLSGGAEAPANASQAQGK